MSEDLQSLINKNPCGICKLKGLSICKCAGSSGGGNSDDAEDVKNDRENFYNTQFQSNIATHKENKSDLVDELNKSIFTRDTEQTLINQQEKVTSQLTAFSSKPIPAPSVNKDNNKQQEEGKTDNIDAPAENKSFNPTPFSMTLSLDR